MSENTEGGADAERYRVPSIERAHRLLALISENPAKLRMIDLVRGSGFHKSSVFVLCKTMARLGWIAQNSAGRFEVGETLACYGLARLFHFEVIRRFHDVAQLLLHRVEAAFQLSILDKTNVLYLAKVEGKNAASIPTYPGLRLPAHSTAMGKVLLSQYTREDLDALYPDGLLDRITQHTISSVEELYAQSVAFKKQGYLFEVGEAIYGYWCMAAAVKNVTGRICAAVSMTMPANGRDLLWEEGPQLIRELSESITRSLGSGAEPC